MKPGILYFTTCFRGFGILRHVDPSVRMLHIFALILQKLKFDLLNYLVICMLCIKSCISYVNVYMHALDTTILHSEDGTRYNIKIDRIGEHIIYSRTVSHMIRSKIDIITITFSLKLPFLESIYVYTSALKIYGTAMPYMSLEFFRLKSSFSCSFSRKWAENCNWLNGFISIILLKYSLKHMQFFKFS